MFTTGLALEKESMQHQLPLPYTTKDSLPDFVGTNVLEHLTIPLMLPELTVDQNYLGHLRWLGWSLYCIIFILAGCFVVWTWGNRSLRVVKAAQPGFLCMICIGVATFGAALVPLGIDDEDNDNFNGQAVCMSPIWCVFLGFTITFSALFAKLWRVNRLFHQAEHFARTSVSSLDVLKPFIIMFTLNSAVLLTWTLVDPLYYERRNMPGTDPWNRVLATYGTCVGDRPWPYVTILSLLNGGILTVANVQAYMARNIQSEFSEAKYVAVAVGCMLQACLIGGPILFVVKEIPQALVNTRLDSLLCFEIISKMVPVFGLYHFHDLGDSPFAYFRAKDPHCPKPRHAQRKEPESPHPTKIAASQKKVLHGGSKTGSHDFHFSASSSMYDSPSQLEIENSAAKKTQLAGIAENDQEDEDTCQNDETTSEPSRALQGNHTRSHHESSATESLVENPFPDDHSASFQVPLGGVRRPMAMSDLTESVVSHDDTPTWSRLSGSTARFVDNTNSGVAPDMPERKRSASATSFPTVEQQAPEAAPSFSNVNMPTRKSSITGTAMPTLASSPELKPSLSNVDMPRRHSSMKPSIIPTFDPTDEGDEEATPPSSSLDKQTGTDPSFDDTTPSSNASDDEKFVNDATEDEP
eukprot:CAMPEP_0168861682 /NCGR_PEP_ID=MMETSP0727-20121128/18047_1 /TAXON_ID=265536 /ORGANISM="Amphiprora sp., Strain CCMP467" /LENGTH=637 /DNA_ID=CAMNT_0008916701 /DNA_START=113 /DNA_END=2027 /DNA_ORIENTATION=+